MFNVYYKNDFGKYYSFLILIYNVIIYYIIMKVLLD